MNRIISLSIEDIYIKYAGEAFGATGSHNALTLRMAFGTAWDGMAKTAYFTDALGSASVSVILGLDRLVDGAYEVDVPSEALKYAGEATVTIKGVLTSGDTTTKAMTTAAGHFRVLDSELPESAGNAGTITASDKEQLQAEIAALEPMFTAYKQAAETAAANAKASENNAKVSEEEAGKASISAAASKTAAAGSANAASASAASASSAANRAETARAAAESTAAGIVTDEAARVQAEAERVQAENARRSAESARQTAETNRAEAETARNVWEDYDGAKEYKAGNKVYWEGSSYVCLRTCTGITPADGTYWQMVARSGFTTDSAFGFDVVNGRLLCYYSGDNPPPFRLGSDGHLYVDLDKSYDLGKVTGDGGSGGGADIDLGITGAAAGQVAKVKTVDSDGKPTAWEPADLPSGGKTWEKIGEWTVPEGSQSIQFSQQIEGLNTYQQIKVFAIFPAVANTAAKSRVGILFESNSLWLTYNVPFNASATTGVLASLVVCDDKLAAESCAAAMKANNVNIYGLDLDSAYALRRNLIDSNVYRPSALSGIRVGVQGSTTDYLDGANIVLYGVKA